jgi:hypothetical protein
MPTAVLLLSCYARCRDVIQSLVAKETIATSCVCVCTVIVKQGLNLRIVNFVMCMMEKYTLLFFCLGKSLFSSQWLRVLSE